MRREIDAIQGGHRNRLLAVAGILVIADDSTEGCSVCCGRMRVLKTVRRNGFTLSHGSFRVRETVRVCTAGCRHEGSPVVGRSAALTALIPPGCNVGYDVLVYTGIERFVHHRQREEIRDGLDKKHGIVLSAGEVSDLYRRFLVYLEALHRVKEADLRAAMEADGGYPLHIDGGKRAGYASGGFCGLAPMGSGRVESTHGACRRHPAAPEGSG